MLAAPLYRSFRHTPRLFLIMVAWSLACTAHGLATGLRSLLPERFLLGAGEGGGFPAATKAVADGFPARTLDGDGHHQCGTAIGAVVAPPLIAAIVLSADWRWAFFACGAAGLLWTVWWALSYHPPDSHPGLSASERVPIGDAGDLGSDAAAVIPWLNLLKLGEVWGLVLAKFLTDGAWYFYLFWLPNTSMTHAAST